MSERKTTVTLGRDSKGQYIKYRRRKVYITAKAKKQIHESGLSGNALTQWLVKWIITKLTKKRRRKRELKNKEYSSTPPKGIATSFSSGQLPLEAQRVQLNLLSNLARDPTGALRLPPPPEQKLLQDVRDKKIAKPAVKTRDPGLLQNPQSLMLPRTRKKVTVSSEADVKALDDEHQIVVNQRNAATLQNVKTEIDKLEKEIKNEESLLSTLVTSGKPFDWQGTGNSILSQLNKLGKGKEKGDTAAMLTTKLQNEIDAAINSGDKNLKKIAKSLPFYKTQLKHVSEIKTKNQRLEKLQRLAEALQATIQPETEEEDEFMSPRTAPEISDLEKSPQPERKAQELSPEEVEASAAAEEEEATPKIEEIDDDAVVGAGQKLTSRSDPLSDDQIDDLMSDIPGYLGTVCRDEITELADQIEHAWNAGIPFGFITLTITRAQATGAGKRPEDTGHWVAVAVIPDTHQLAYYDSFGEPAPLAIKSVLKEIFDKVAPRTLLKFKENLIQEQSVNSDNCGWFCIKFLLDMFHGRDFVDATKYNQVAKSEKNIEAFKKKFKPFGWL